MGSVQIKGGQIVDSAIIAAKLASNAVTSAKTDRDWETRLNHFFHDNEEIIGC